MKFKIAQSSGGEVIFAGGPGKGKLVTYGGLPTTGVWKIVTPKFEQFISNELEPFTYGNSIDLFVFGMEIAELQEWGAWFAATRDYVSYRPKSKTIVSVGQIEWKDVKDLTASEQFPYLIAALSHAISQVSSAKRKPKHFDVEAFTRDVERALSGADVSDFLLD